jgi:peptidoglycan/xylan/chitin deacetylase (PgdA/CDA1 family)
VSQALKTAIKQLCNAGRVNEAFLATQHKDLLVLCYHGVLAEARPDRWSYENWVGADQFRAQLRWLKRILEPVDLAGVARWRDARLSGKRGPVLVTFDDGYRNNRTVAAPILKEEGVPALFFLATGYIGTSRTLWHDEMRMRVLQWPLSQIRLPSGQLSHLPAEIHGRRQLAVKITQESKRLGEIPCADFLEYLRSNTPAAEVMDDREAREFMTWDEARSLAAAGFELGSHTVEHPILSTLSREKIASELRESKAVMERELKRPCTSIAYPNGTESDINETLFEEVRGAGYDWAFTTAPHHQKRGGDPRRIARICVPGHADLATFKLYASGLHSRLS